MWFGQLEFSIGTIGFLTLLLNAMLLCNVHFKNVLFVFIYYYLFLQVFTGEVCAFYATNAIKHNCKNNVFSKIM